MGDYFASIPTVLFKHKGVVGVLALAILGAGVARYSRDSNSFSVVSENPCTANFNVISGDLNNANLIFLGELHSRREESIACIRYLKPDILAVESVPSGQIINCAFKISEELPGTTCIGWDSPEVEEENVANGVRAGVIFFLKTFYEAYKQQNLSQKQFDTSLEKLLNKFQKEVQDLEKIHQFKEINAKKSFHFTKEESTYQASSGMVLELNKIRALRQQNHNVDEIFSLYQDEFKSNYFSGTATYNPFDKDWTDKMIQRNTKMIETIEQFSKPDKKMVILSGLRHVKTHPTVITPTDEAVHLVHKTLLTRNYYAILAMEDETRFYAKKEKNNPAKPSMK